MGSKEMGEHDQNISYGAIFQKLKNTEFSRETLAFNQKEGKRS